MSYTVNFSPEALAQLHTLEDHISDAGAPRIAARFIDTVISYCESIGTCPLRGNRRDDLLPTLRLTHFRHTTVIAFMVAADTETVSILGMYDGGQNYAALADREINDKEDNNE